MDTNQKEDVMVVEGIIDHGRVLMLERLLVTGLRVRLSINCKGDDRLLVSFV